MSISSLGHYDLRLRDLNGLRLSLGGESDVSRCKDAAYNRSPIIFKCSTITRTWFPVLSIDPTIPSQLSWRHASATLPIFTHWSGDFLSLILRRSKEHFDMKRPYRLTRQRSAHLRNNEKLKLALLDKDMAKEPVDTNNLNATIFTYTLIYSKT
jgi:hypothetical protein